MKEINTTGNVSGFNSPLAFKPTPDIRKKKKKTVPSDTSAVAASSQIKLTFLSRPRVVAFFFARETRQRSISTPIEGQVASRATRMLTLPSPDPIS